MSAQPVESIIEPGNLESHGSVCLSLDLAQLLQSYNVDFAKRAWRKTLSQPRSIDTTRLLRVHRLTEHEAGPFDHFHALRPRAAGKPKTLRDLTRMAGQLVELRQGGVSKSDAAYTQQAHHWAGSFCPRVADAVAEALNTGGAAAATEVLQQARSLVEGWLLAARGSTSGLDSPQSQSNLAAIAEDLNRLQRDPSPVASFARRLNRDAPLSVTRSSSARTELAKIAKVLDDFHQKLHRDKANEACIPVLEKLNDDGGFLEGIAQTIQESTVLVDAYGEETPVRLRPAGPEELLLVTGLEDRCGPQGETFGQLLDRLAARAGCTPKGFADRLWNRGLEVGGRRVRPPQWRGDALPQLYEALLKETAVYLGIDDLDRTLQIARPKTAADHFASLCLLHPTLRTRLLSVLSEWVRLARPHLDVPGARRARQNAYLHCLAADRAEWCDLLSNHLAVAPAPHGGGDLSHPMRVVLTISVFGLNAHRLPQLQDGLHQAALSESTGEPILRHEHGGGELRLLEHRPEASEEYRQLIFACVSGGVVRPLSEGQDRLMLTRSEPSVRRYFYAAQIEALEQSARYFQRQLGDDRFVRFVEVHLPGVEDWPSTARRLAEAAIPTKAANELASLGVLERRVGAGYAMAGPPPSSLRHAPEGLYHWQYGDAVGLSKERFVAALRDDQRFFSIVTFHALDAWIDGRLTGEDLPPFVRELRERLESD